MNKAEFVSQVEKAKAELYTAKTMAFYDGNHNGYTHARYIENAIHDLDALLHIQEISKD
jgi:hypothetical protein